MSSDVCLTMYVQLREVLFVVMHPIMYSAKSTAASILVLCVVHLLDLLE